MYIGRQEWDHLLFVHYEVDRVELRSLVPSPLELDTYEGKTWVTLIPFRIRRSRPRLVPRAAAPLLPGSSFEELNFRTYVTGPDGQPGIWFFSLDAASAVAVSGARSLYKLPYEHARMALSVVGDTITFFSKRTDGPQHCEARYRPLGTPASALAGTLDHFLVERYVLFAMGRGGVYAARVRHQPYPLQDAALEDWRENFLETIGLETPHFAKTHYVARLVVDIGMLHGVKSRQHRNSRIETA
ncbi:MAG: YqjF family protein [Thermoanaerobaculia bacterium]